LSPEHVRDIACVAGRQRYFDIVNDKEADEPKLSRLGVAGADEVRSAKFTIVPNGALLDQAAGVNHVPVFEPRPSLRGVEERESAVAVESTPDTLASLHDAPRDLGSHMDGHLENYYLPPDECYDWLDDDEAYAAYILGRSGEHRTVGGKVTAGFNEVLAVVRAAGPKTVAELT
jgi:hypothetical protein